MRRFALRLDAVRLWVGGQELESRRAFQCMPRAASTIGKV